MGMGSSGTQGLHSSSKHLPISCSSLCSLPMRQLQGSFPLMQAWQGGTKSMRFDRRHADTGFSQVLMHLKNSMPEEKERRAAARLTHRATIMGRRSMITGRVADNNYLMPYNQDIEHALISFACTFPPYNVRPVRSLGEFSSGMVFAHLLATVEHFPLGLKDLQPACERWIEKLTNLKIIVQRMEGYMREGGKSLLTRDIELIEIAKHESATHILRFFELVVAVFMQSPHKEDYIQTIMHLDERSQQALVEIVQNAIGERLVDSSRHSLDNRLAEQLQELASQNELLREEVKEMGAAGEKHKRELLEAREVLEEVEEKYRQQGTETMGTAEVEQLRAMNDNLKVKLLQSVREHQEELSRSREENIFLQNKLLHLKEYEETIEHLREQLADSQGDRDRVTEQDREKRKLTRALEEKDAIIRQLREKLEETSEKNYNMQETELYMKMELEKKEVRFKQLENEVKSRLKADHPAALPPALLPPSHTLDADELDYLQEEIEKLRGSYRELERENLKLKKKVEKSQGFEGEKKKLEKIILDVSKSKDAEIEMLLTSLYDLRTENIRIHELLTTKQ